MAFNRAAYFAKLKDKQQGVGSSLPPVPTQPKPSNMMKNIPSQPGAPKIPAIPSISADTQKIAKFPKLKKFF